MNNYPLAEQNPVSLFRFSIAKETFLLNKLKETADINIINKSADIEQAKIIAGYAHRLFNHNGTGQPSASDPLAILKEAQNGESFRCVEYSILATGLLWAYNIPARTIGLKTNDVETFKYGAGHVVTEFWSYDYQKWIMCDVQAGIIPTYNDLPLSAYELKNHLEAGDVVTYQPVTNSRYKDNTDFGEKQNYTEWIREYLCFIDTPVDLTLDNRDRRTQQIIMLVPSNKRPPKSFGGMFDMNVIYTNKVSDFYPIMPRF